MISLALLHYYLGLEIQHIQDQIFISQMKYTKKLLDKFKMKKSDAMSILIEPGLYFSCHDYSPLVNTTLYLQLIRWLIYLAYTRLDICYIVSYLLRFMYELNKGHQTMVKHILRYIHGTDNYKLEYNKNDKFILSRYMDANYGGSLDDKR